MRPSSDDVETKAQAVEIERLRDINRALVGKSNGYVVMNAKLEEERDTLRKHLNELLAVLHGDGGHYLADHGAKKAVADALEKIYAGSRLRDALRQQLAKLKEYAEDHAVRADDCGRLARKILELKP